MNANVSGGGNAGAGPDLVEELVAASPNQKNWKGISIAIFVIGIILASVALSVVLLTPPDDGGKVKGTRFTIKHLLDPIFSPRQFNGSWISATELVFLDATGGLSIFDVESVSHSQLVSNTTFRRFNVARYSLSPNRRYVLLVHQVEKRYRYSSFAHYTVYEIETGSTWSVSATSDFNLSPGPPKLLYAAWAPSTDNATGNAIVFVENYTVYYIPDVSPVEKRVFPLSDVDTVVPEVVINGVPDWLYEEDILKRDSAIWFSPDGRKLVYVQFNDSAVEEVRWLLYGDGSDTSVEAYPEEKTMRYPKAGTKNPTVKLKMVDLSDLNNIQAQNLDPPHIIRNQDHYFMAVSWIGADGVAINWMNRAQNQSLVAACRKPTWVCKETFSEEIPPLGWSTLYAPALYSANGDSFLIRTPLRDGLAGFYRHIALVKNNQLSFPITLGQFEVEKILAWNEDENIVYFLGIPQDLPAERHLFQVSVDAINGPKVPICITCKLPKEVQRECNSTKVHISPSFQYYVLECLGPGVPSVHLLDLSNSSYLTTLNNHSSVVEASSKMAWPDIELMKVPLGNGKSVNAKVYLPPGLDKEDVIKYPVIVHVYSGPGTQLVTHPWKVDYNVLLASQHGYVVVEFDVVGSGGQGEALRTGVKRQLGKAEVLEQILATKSVVTRFPFIDASKVAVSGVSYGGYVALMMLSDKEHDLFQCGVSVSPVVDWRYYESAYSERYMGFPTASDNFRGYEEGSLVDRAGNILGKQLFLAHGMADRNVHIQNMMVFTKALVWKQVQFEQQIYPDEGHLMDGVREHLFLSVEAFLEQCFKDEVPKVEGS